MTEQAGFLIEKIIINGKMINPIPKGFEGKSFNYSYGVDSAISLNLDKLRYNVNVSISETDKDVLLANFNLVYFLKAVNLKTIVQEDGNNHFQIPSNLDNNFKLIVLDSTRGVIFSELRGTYLDNAILPIIDETAFIERQNVQQEELRQQIEKLSG